MIHTCKPLMEGLASHGHKDSNNIGPCWLPPQLLQARASTCHDHCLLSYCCAQGHVRQSLVTATAASSCIASLLMGIGANLPVALAPGMGLNAYFAYNVVGYRGSGNVCALSLALLCFSLHPSSSDPTLLLQAESRMKLG